MQLFSFFKRLRSHEKSVSTGSWANVTGNADATERNLLASNKEWVYIAVDRIASSLAGIRFKVMRYQKTGDDVEVFDGALVDWLERPARNYTGKDFIYLNTVYKELTGNAFWERDGKFLRPLLPSHMSPVLSATGEVTAYRYTADGKERVIPAKDILHDRYVDPARPYWGVGKLAKIARWVDSSSFANEFLRRFFLNGAQFGGFIETDEESEERIQLIKAGLINDHAGVENAHKIAVLPRNSKFAPATANMSDMEMGATDDRYRDKILSGFGVPKTLVGLTTEVNRASAEAAEYVYARYTLKPIADDLLEFLNNNIAATLDPSGRMYFAYDEFIPVNQDLIIREREIALARQPYKTVNEVRAEVGLPPVKGGDDVYGNPFQVPLGQPTQSPNLPTEDDETDDDDIEDNEPIKAIPPRLRKALRTKRLIEGIATKAQEVIASHHDNDEAKHKKFVARVDAHEKILAGKIRDFNNRQHREVTQNLARITKAIAKGDLFDMDGEVAVLVDFVSPMLKGLMLEQAIEEYKAEGFNGTLDTTSPSINKAIDFAAKRMAKSYNNTTALLLKKALNEGIGNGDDLVQLAERVKTVYEFSDQVRAMAVARTESVYIANEGSKEAYRQSGVVKTVRWYTAEDERVCEFCGPMNGREVGVNETYFKKGETVHGANGGSLDTDYRAIDVPPLHTNCRCLIRPEVIEID